MSSPKVIIYGNASCPYCGAARMLLKKRSVEFEDISVTGDASLLEEMQQKSGRRSVPQIFIGDHHVGGLDELDALNRSGELDKLLAD